MADAIRTNSANQRANGGDLPDAMERMAFLEEWIGKRLADAEAADARLAKRLAAAEKAEEGLRGLYESLRKQVAEVSPLLSRLTEFGKNGEAGRMVAEMAEKLEQSRGEARDFLDGLPKAVTARVEVFKGEIERGIAGATEVIARRTEELETKSGVFEDWIEGQMEAARGEIEKAGRAEVLRRAAELKAVAEGMEGKSARLVDEARRRIGALVMELEGLVREKIGETGQWMERLRAEMERDGEMTINGIKTDARRVVEGAVADVRREIRPAIGAAEEQCNAMRRKMEGIVGECRMAMEERMLELGAAAERMVVEADERLARKVRDFRPGMMEAAAEAEGEMAERLRQALEASKEALALHEGQVVRQAEGLRPRVMSMVRAMEAEVKASLARMEEEAAAQLGWLERRLRQRVEEAAEQQRTTLRTEAMEQKRRPEVEVFLGAEQLRKEAAA